MKDVYLVHKYNLLLLVQITWLKDALRSCTREGVCAFTALSHKFLLNSVIKC